MLFRLGQVLWWLGALVATAGIGAAFLSPNWTNNVGAVWAVVGVLCLLVTLPAWAASFVLAGSFWKPPKQ